MGIGSGFVVLFGLFASRRMDGWTAVFLVTTTATSVTGFGFPFVRFLPSHGVGIVSLLVLLIALLARYRFHLGGAWRWLYSVSVVFALYLNVFVLIAQAFSKVPQLKALAPTQSEPPFIAAQLVVLALFFVFAGRAVKRFRVGPVSAVSPKPSRPIFQ